MGCVVSGRRRRRREATQLHPAGVEIVPTPDCVEHPSPVPAFVTNRLWFAHAVADTVAETLRRAGLYDPRFEHDACGTGSAADAGGRASREIVDAALAALNRVRHRGAVAADARSGDGAGILLPLPQAFYRDLVTRTGLGPQSAARIGVATVFLSNLAGDEGDAARRGVRHALED